MLASRRPIVTLLYRAGGRVWRVRALLWTSLVAAAACVYWGLDLYRTYGLRPADGGVLASAAVRTAWLAGVAGSGLAAAAAMWGYARCYVAALWLDETTDRVAIDLAGAWRGRRLLVPRLQISSATYHDGVFDSGRQQVRAPWYTLRIDGQRWPLVLDAAGQPVHLAGLRRVLSGGRR